MWRAIFLFIKLIGEYNWNSHTLSQVTARLFPLIAYRDTHGNLVRIVNYLQIQVISHLLWKRDRDWPTDRHVDSRGRRGGEQAERLRSVFLKRYISFFPKRTSRNRKKTIYIHVPIYLFDAVRLVEGFKLWPLNNAALVRSPASASEMVCGRQVG